MADVEEVEKEVSLVVEDGSCIPSANCYVSLEYADEYMRNTGHGSWAKLDDNTRRSLLINATAYIDRTYSKIGWKGIKKYHRNQPLCFPRVELYDKDGFEVEGIPEELMKAVCEAGFIASSTSLFTVNSASGEVKRKKAETLEIEYFSSNESAAGYISRFSVLDSLLSDFYKTKNSGSRCRRAVHLDMLGGRL